MSVAATRKGHAGLSVGSHTPNVANGTINSNVTNTINVITKSLNTPHNHDWLRINDEIHGAGKVAVFGNLSVADTRKGQAGLTVGAFNAAGKPGRIGIVH